MWEPGPEDGNYYSENPVWVNPCEEGYGLSDGVCITLEEMNKDNPICGPNPKHDFGKCNRVYEEPENTLDHVLAYCNATGAVTDEERRWWNTTHYIDNVDCEFLDKVRGSDTYGLPIEEDHRFIGGPGTQPEPEPPTFSDEQNQMMADYCATGIRHPDMIGILQCVANVPGCGPAPMFIDGTCSPFDLENPSKGLVLGLIVVVALCIGIAGIIVVTRKKVNR